MNIPMGHDNLNIPIIAVHLIQYTSSEPSNPMIQGPGVLLKEYHAGGSGQRPHSREVEVLDAEGPFPGGVCMKPMPTRITRMVHGWSTEHADLIRATCLHLQYMRLPRTQVSVNAGVDSHVGALEDAQVAAATLHKVRKYSGKMATDLRLDVLCFLV